MKIFSVSLSLRRFAARVACVVPAVVALAGVAGAGMGAPRDFEAEWKAIGGDVGKAGFAPMSLPNDSLHDKVLQRIDTFIDEAFAAEDYANAFRGVVLRGGLVVGEYGDKESCFENARIINAYRERMPVALRAALDVVCAMTWESAAKRDFHVYCPKRRKNKHSGASGDEVARPRDEFDVRGEIVRLYELALAESAALQQTPVGALKGSIGKGDYPEERRPTLFDVVAYRAIEFFTPKEDAVEVDAFVPPADGAVLGSLEEFLAWRPERPAVASDNFRVLELFQALLRFHQSDAKRAVALADADLQRILWAGEILRGDRAARTRLKQALHSHLERWKALEVSADTAAELALHYWRDKRDDAEMMRKAREIAMLGIARHPDSHGAKRCRALVAQLEKRNVERASTEYVWNTPRPELTVVFNNIDCLHFRVVRGEWLDDVLAKCTPAQLLEKKPVVAWQEELPKVDFITRTHTVAVPGDLEPGFYYILGSAKEDFSAKENILFALRTWVSDIAVVKEMDPHQERLSGFVMNALTGDFVSGATVRAWRVTDSDRVEIPSVKTDATGAFSFTTPEPHRVQLLAVAPNGHSVAFDERRHAYPCTEAKAEATVTRRHARFLTGGHLFHPGQDVHFKAIIFSANDATAHCAPIKDHPFTVILGEPAPNLESKEIARLELRTNDYGAASGVFTLPRDKVGCNYMLYSPNLVNAAGYLSVVPPDAEVAKKPDFEVTLDGPATTPRFGDTVSLEGKALTKTGVPLAGAKVSWGVGRKRHDSNTNTGIAGGATTTDATGRFQLTFPLEADNTETSKTESRFHYEVVANVTNAAGKCGNTMRTLVVGPAVLRARLRASEWQVPAKPVTLTISTRSFDGSVPRKNEGLVTLYALKQPPEVIRPKISPYLYAIHGDTASNTAEWEAGDRVTAQSYTTDAKGKTELNIPLPTGAYRAILTTQDQYGTPVTARTDIVVADPDATFSAHKVPFRVVVADEKPFAPGATFTALWSSGYTAARAHVIFSKNGKIFHQFSTGPGRTQQIITLPITAQHQGGFTVQVFQVSENQFYSKHKVVDVPFVKQRLDLALENFNPKLVPGSREAWTLRVGIPDGANGEPKPAPEVAAILYDTSFPGAANYAWWGFNEEYGVFNKENHYNHGVGSHPTHFSNHEHGTYVENRFPASPFAHIYYWSMGRYPNFGFSIGSDYRHMTFPAPPREISSFNNAISINWLDPEDFPPGEPIVRPPLTSAMRKTLGGVIFFHPALVTGSDGTVRIEFTVPKTPGRWKFLALAHDQQLRSVAYAADGVIVEDVPGK
ncbi:MAG: hypothetical protein LBD14_04050 [Puniceicoccales bacterium]|jgi:hypothetical protein|nr:hypothetical protein [Puniceicoccales bacterium]